MAVDVYPPGRDLAGQVQVFTVMDLEGPGDVGAPERIVPDGIVELVFHYETPFAMRYPGEVFAIQPRSFAISQTHRFVEIRPAGRGGFVSARLYPWAAARLFALPVSEFADAQVAADELWGTDVRRLEEELASARGPTHRVHLLRRFLRRKLRPCDGDALRGWVQTIRRHRGDVSIRRLCSELGVGERRLERGFRRSVGTSPKHFARITRFLHTCRVLRDGDWGNLAEAAQACGFADQAHFNRDFRAFSGLTPREFVRDDRVAYLED